MSKSKKKPEDIFFGLQRMIDVEEDVVEAPAHIPPERPDEVDTIDGSASVDEKQPAQVEQQSGERRKRGPVPNPENQRRVPVNVHVAPETKYTMKSLINEMKLRGYVDRYTMTDFVAEAIEEKIAREKKRFGLN